jgi:hypothetical protein
MGMSDSDPFALPPRLAAVAEGLPLEELAFTPVPVRPRRDGWSPERQRAFIVRLALCGSVTASAQAVGKTRKAAYDLLRRPGSESFAAAWDRAFGYGRSRTCDFALERALLGEVKPVFYRGRRCGEHIRHDNRLLLALLRAGIGSGGAEGSTENKRFFP